MTFFELRELTDFEKIPLTRGTWSMVVSVFGPGLVIGARALRGAYIVEFCILFAIRFRDICQHFNFMRQFFQNRETI